MAKRLTDTDKWKFPFFKALPSAYKLLWLYIKDDVDFCGFWIPDFEIACLRIGEKVNEKKAIELFGSEIAVLNDGRWHVPSFVKDQYNELKQTNAFHLKVIEAIAKVDHMRTAKVSQAGKKSLKGDQKQTVDTVQCPDIRKDIEKDINLNKKEPELFIHPTFEEFWELYSKKNDRNKCEKAWEKLSQPEKEAIMAHVPEYKLQQPDKKFRKDPYTYLYNKSWNNEIIKPGTGAVSAKSSQTAATGNYLKDHYRNKLGGGKV